MRFTRDPTEYQLYLLGMSSARAYRLVDRDEIISDELEASFTDNMLQVLSALHYRVVPDTEDAVSLEEFEGMPATLD